MYSICVTQHHVTRVCGLEVSFFTAYLLHTTIMSYNINEYFNRNFSDWSITGFLNECAKEPFQAKIDDYIKSLIAITSGEQGRRQSQAQVLLAQYREASIFFLILT